MRGHRRSVLHQLPEASARTFPAADAARRPRALLYCHDTFGLGHLRRTLSVAQALHDADVVEAQLIVTGSPVGTRFELPPDTDLVKLPAVVKVGDERYEARSLPMRFPQVRALRRELILGAAKAFAPDLVIVDHAPAGCAGEILPALQHLRRTNPAARLAVGLRDVVDDPARVRAAWARDGIDVLLDELYDLILVYGDRDVHDVVAEYGFSRRAAAKTRFVGYLRRDAGPVGADVIRTMHDLDTERLVLVTLGGGGDGEAILRAAVTAAADPSAPRDLGWLLVEGPLMPDVTRKALAAEVAGLPRVRLVPTLDDVPGHLASVDIAVAMGGYNTVCEIMAAGCRAIVVPRVEPRTEQLIRAEALARRGLFAMLHPAELDGPRLLAEVLGSLGAPRPERRPRLDGLERMAAEVRASLERTRPEPRVLREARAQARAPEAGDRVVVPA